MYTCKKGHKLSDGKIIINTGNKKEMSYWKSITASRTKKISSYGSYRFFFARLRQTLQMSTLIRMNYLCQPIAGLLFITVNFFQDGSCKARLQFRLDVLC